MTRTFAQLEQLIIHHLVRLDPVEEHLDVRCQESPTRFLAPTEELPASR